MKLDDHQCEDCPELQAFARHPERREHRFRVRQDRRFHLEQIIQHHGLDIACKTERTGSPQTLVCTKTRWSYQKRQEQYARDLQSLRTLAKAGKMLPKELEPLQIRIEEATARVPRGSQ